MDDPERRGAARGSRLAVPLCDTRAVLRARPRSWSASTATQPTSRSRSPAAINTRSRSPNPISEYAREGMLALGRRLGAYRAVPHAARGHHRRITRRAAARYREPGKPTERPRPATSIATAIRWASSRAPGSRCSARSRTSRTSRFWPNCVVTHLSSRRQRASPRCTSSTRAGRSGGHRQARRGRLFGDRDRAAAEALGGAATRSFDRRINQNARCSARYFLTHCFGGAAPLDARAASTSPRRSTPTGRPTSAPPTSSLTRSALGRGAIYNNTSDQALPLHCPHPGSQDLDTLWQGS